MVGVMWVAVDLACSPAVTVSNSVTPTLSSPSFTVTFSDTLILKIIYRGFVPNPEKTPHLPPDAKLSHKRQV
jgi:hypothetical protein